MTKKDYVKFAAMLKAIGEQYSDHHILNVPVPNPTIHAVVTLTANLFADDNPNFDRARFLAACGVKS